MKNREIDEVSLERMVQALRDTADKCGARLKTASAFDAA